MVEKKPASIFHIYLHMYTYFPYIRFLRDFETLGLNKKMLLGTDVSLCVSIYPHTKTIEKDIILLESSLYKSTSQAYFDEIPSGLCSRGTENSAECVIKQSPS